MSAATVTARKPRETSPMAVAVMGLVALAVFVVLILTVQTRATYDLWASFLVAPALIIVSLPILAREAKREGDKKLFWFLLAALVLKIVIGTFLRYYNTVEVNGGTDSNKYHAAGLDMYERFRSGNFNSGLPHLTGTHFIRFMTGVVYTVIGPSRAGAFVIFSWLAFWGYFFFYKAFKVAVPDGRSITYARFVFLLPTLIFWPSSLGKEAWMLFSLGIAAYGAALVLGRKLVPGLLVAGLGMWMATLVRPYMAGMVALGLSFGYALRKRNKKLGGFAPFAKFAGLGILIVISGVLVAQTQEFLNERNVNTDAGVTGSLDEVNRRSSQGGSEFEATAVSSPAQVPIAFVTVIFRPFVFEAHTVRALISALEGMLLLGLTIKRLPWIISAFKNIRTHPYLLTGLIFVGLFVIAFSSIGNFGILARQRSMVLPMYAVLLSIPPPRREPAEDSSTELSTV